MIRKVPGQRHNYLLLWENGKAAPTNVFLVKRPGVGEKGFYQQSLSFQYWRNRELKGAYPGINGLKKKPTPFHFSTMDYQEYENHARMWVRVCDTCPGPTKPDRSNDEDYIFWFNDTRHACLTFNSIYDFYAHIGYDYKRQKYMDGKGVKLWLNL